MNWKRVDGIVSACVFAYALVLYVLTVAPTASFWDAGEFIAISYGLQVSHPPGAPFYMLIGRLFSMFVPTEFVSLAVNMVSVMASAVTILLTYWIIVRLIREWQGNPDEWNAEQRVIAITGGVIGACTFAVTDSFWFNAVEAEVYALSMLFTAAVVWLIMRWSDYAQREQAASYGRHHPFGLDANRTLILVAYLFGLAIGVHLLSLLAVFFIALIFFFVQFDRPDWTRSGQPPVKSGRRWLGIAGAGIVASGGFLVIYPVIVQKLPGWAGATGWPMTTLFAVFGTVVFAVWFSHRRRMQVINLTALCVLMVLIGYSTYALIFIRSAADPPIDENDPETAEAIVSYLEREQYGPTPIFKGTSFNDRTNQPDLGEKVFPRRHSQMPAHWQVYARYDSDFEFFWKYQVGHMYVRYFLWNFSGRESDVQNARSITGIPFIDGEYETFFQTPSERASRNRYFALPLLLGLLGMLYHFSMDWRRAFCVLVLFLITGLGIILYLNQSPMQPRERDYSYVASFFAFSLWIGIGATGITQFVVDWVRERVSGFERGMLIVLPAVLFLAVPGWMAIENYDDHDRSGRYVAPDYAYNMLNSVEQNGILFTNGDNDTFPLWYLQEVEGVRRDVRVANLSLLNTPWYIRQLKHQFSRDSAPLPISLEDGQIANIGYQLWRPQTVTLPVDIPQLVGSTEVYVAEDVVGIESPMQWLVRGRSMGTNPSTGEDVSVLYAADIAVLDIVRTNALQGWTRPIYFAVTVSPDGQVDLQNYFQLEGQASRVLPIRHQERLGRAIPTLTPERLRGFRFRNLDDPTVYYDENIRRMTDNYRNVFAHTALALAENGKEDEAIALLDDLMEQMPFDTIAGDIRSYLLLAQAYQESDAQERVVDILQYAGPLVLYQLDKAESSADVNLVFEYVQLINQTYLIARDFEAAAAFQTRLNLVLDDSTRVDPDDLRREYEGDEAPDG